MNMDSMTSYFTSLLPVILIPYLTAYLFLAVAIACDIPEEQMFSGLLELVLFGGFSSNFREMFCKGAKAVTKFDTL